MRKIETSNDITMCYYSKLKFRIIKIETAIAITIVIKQI